MLTVYSNQISKRLKHTVKLLFSEVMNYEFSITNNLEEFNAAKGVRINYTPLDINDAIQIIPSGLLFERSIEEKKVAIGKWENETILFPNNGAYIPFDLLSATFYLTSRYEEYINMKRDHYNRFLPEESIAFKNDFLERPLVNIWAQKLQEVIAKFFPVSAIPERKYEFVATIDVDNAYAYKEKGVVRSLGALSRSILIFDFKDFVNRFKCLLGLTPDPFDSFDKQLEFQKKYGFKAVYFFLVGDYGLNDKNVPISSRKFQSLIKHIGDYASVGVHPSFASNEEPERVKMEMDRLAKVVHVPNKKPSAFLDFIFSKYI